MAGVPRNETLAFWLAPLASVIPLIPLFGLRSSPLFLGTLMGDPGHPMNWPGWGSWLATMAVAFDGTILAYLMALVLALPAYSLYRQSSKVSAAGILILFSLVGVCASRFAYIVQGFKQPGLTEFANSWSSPLIGTLCGLTAGLFFLIFKDRTLSRITRRLIYPLPILVLTLCGAVLAESAKVWRAGPHW
jgi:hypothetical protein